MKKIGLAGGIGSGKTFVSDTFAELGAQIVDADVISRNVTALGAPSVSVIAEYFGPEVLQEDGGLDRKALKDIIFNNAKDKQWLEQLLHPIIRNEIIRQLENPHCSYTILASPLLFETNQNTLVDKVITVDLPVELQLQRTRLRDHNNSMLIQKIINSQWSREERLKASDFIIDNSGSKESTIKQVRNLHKILTNL